MKLKTKPQPIKEIDALQYDGDNTSEVIDFVGDAPNFKCLDGHIIIMANSHIGWFIRKGDWIYIDKRGNAVVLSPEERLKDWEET